MEYALLGDFEGAIHLKYNGRGLLITFDIHARLTDQQYEYVITQMPVNVEKLEAYAAKANMQVMTEKNAFTFDDFWERYRNNKDKARAIPKWFALSFFHRILAVVMIHGYDKELAKSGVKKLYGEGYLSKKRFLEVKIG